MNSLTRLLRCYKEGNIQIPFNNYYLRDKNDKQRLLLRHSPISTVMDHTVFKLTKDEIKDLRNFLNNTKMPFKKDFIKLAFENFEVCYDVINNNLKFLTLMNSMEVLFHPSDKGELRYRISRNLAVLLGNNKKECQDYFKIMREFYDKRSLIVHTGKANINEEDIIKLREMLEDLSKCF